MDDDLIKRWNIFVDRSQEYFATYWTIPFSFTPKEIYDLSYKNDNEIDDYFLGYYQIRSKNYNDSIHYIKNNLTIYRNLFIQIEQNLSDGNYLICIPSEILILEGCISDYTNSRSTHIVDLIKEKMNSEQNEVKKIMLSSMLNFVTKLYSCFDFDRNKQLMYINRHWIEHGRDSGAWELIDAIRLLQAIETLIFISK